MSRASRRLSFNQDNALCVDSEISAQRTPSSLSGSAVRPPASANARSSERRCASQFRCSACLRASTTAQAAVSSFTRSRSNGANIRRNIGGGISVESAQHHCRPSPTSPAPPIESTSPTGWWTDHQRHVAIQVRFRHREQFCLDLHRPGRREGPADHLIRS